MLTIATLCLLGIQAIGRNSEKDSLATLSGRTFYYELIYRNKKERPKPAEFVFVSLISGHDTVSTMSSIEGAFEFYGIKPGKKRLVANSVQFKTTVMEFDILPGDNALMVEVARDWERLAASKVVAKIAPVVIRGDTLVFQPSAVATLDGDSALEILRQMPGVEIRDGNIYVNGQQIKRAYVNGSMLFGDNPMAPLSTLMASEVTKIHSYEESSVEMRIKGDKHGVMDRVLDIHTKEAFVSAYDAFAQGAGGFDAMKKENGSRQGRYFAGINANFFSEKLLIYLNSFSNNIGAKNNTFRTVEGTLEPFRKYQQEDHLRTGIHKYWGDRLLGSNFKVDYRLIKNSDRAFSHSLSSYAGSPDSPERVISDTLTMTNSSVGHRISVSLNLNDEKWKNLQLLSSFTSRSEESHDTHLQWNYERESNRYHLAETHGRITDSWSGNTSIKWNNHYSKSWIKPVFQAEFSKAPLNTDRWTIDTLASSLNRRYLTIDEGNDNVSANGMIGAEISLWNTEKSTSGMTLDYSIMYENLHQKQMGLDLYGPEVALPEPVTNSINTFDFSRRFISHGPHLSYHASTKKIDIQLEGELGFGDHIDRESIPETASARHPFILPAGIIDLRYGGFHCYYKINSSIPAIEQLRVRLNDNNPLYLVAGNPDLRQSFTHHVHIEYLQMIGAASGQLRLSADYNGISGAIVNRSFYYSAPTRLDSYNYTTVAGSTLTTFENCDGSWMSSLMANYTQRLQTIKTTLTTQLIANFQQTPYYIGDRLDYYKGFYPSMVCDVKFNPNRHLSLSGTINCSYQKSMNNSGQILTRILSTGGNISFTWSSSNGLYLKGSYRMSRYSPLYGPTSSITNNLLAFVAGKTFMKGRLRVSIAANDILNKGCNYKIEGLEDRVVETWNPNYGRNYILTVAYRINKRNPSVKYQGKLSTGLPGAF